MQATLVYMYICIIVLSPVVKVEYAYMFSKCRTPTSLLNYICVFTICILVCVYL